MDLWVAKVTSVGLQLTGEVLRQKWRVFADLGDIPEEERLTLSDGWLTRFKERNGLKRFKCHGKAGSVDPHGMPPDTGLSNRVRSGVKGKKVCLMYAFTANADGSEKLQPFVIGKAQKPRAFNKKTGAQLGFYYRNNAKAWMTTSLYQEWLLDFDRRMGEQGRKILLLQDNFSGHVPPRNLQHIRVENFEPNLTSHVQPNDAGIIRCFKAHYRRAYISRSIDRYEAGITPSEIYDINQLEAMRLANEAWRNVDTRVTTIRHCWGKAGILPALSTNAVPVQCSDSSTRDPIARVEQSVEKTLDALQATGALQSSNSMTIESLLNPAEEQDFMKEGSSDQDIWFDDVNEDSFIPRPTHREALKAVSVIQRYAQDIDEPFARKLENLLASFGRQTRLEDIQSAMETQLTDFFTRE
ncbi:DDE-domain-containing protein [Dendrothele bispora CBS 962.96]|uniref:DDE-domain-containing protein n=1 Tax=Dendrothele bispora (strain CBS 962.96) TaxID=1314807 RepID=A0A4V4HDS5_DENBC|nr:DDE-domain-containing protein [Dendrothele bispora CBS 962.96]